MFSSVKISTYKYCKTNKTLSFIYQRLYAHRFGFWVCISTPQKEFFNYCNETTPLHNLNKKTLEKNNITLLYISDTANRGT